MYTVIPGLTQRKQANMIWISACSAIFFLCDIASMVWQWQISTVHALTTTQTAIVSTVDSVSGHSQMELNETLPATEICIIIM